nr:MAG TPA: hypothetical protein [Bacteriophage sp.]
MAIWRRMLIACLILFHCNYVFLRARKILVCSLANLLL